MKLTERQKEYVRLMRQGLTYPEMAEELGVSIHTVKHTSSKLLDLTGMDSKLQLVLFAERNHLLDEPVKVAECGCPYCRIVEILYDATNPR